MSKSVMLKENKPNNCPQSDIQISFADFPDKKSENWKYFPVKSLVKKICDDCSAKNFRTDCVTFSGKNDFVSVNRSFDAHKKLKKISKTDEWFIYNLNHSLNKDCFVIDIPENYSSGDGCLDINYIANEHTVASAPLIFINCKKNSKFTIYEKFNTPNCKIDGDYWLLPVIIVFMEENASLELVKIHNAENENQVTTSFSYAQLAKNSQFSSTIISGEQSKALRNQYVIDMNGQNSRAQIKGLSLQKEDQISESNIRINHIAPDCYSKQEMKYVLSDSSKGIFQGTINVDRQAQKTDAHQLSNTIILGDTAEMNTKPELEIYADDVKCSHGATGGYIDPEQIFYLRSRGFSEEQAKQIIIEAFANEITESINSDSHREYAKNALMRYFASNKPQNK